MDYQHIFNRVTEHLLTQRVQATNCDNETCSYRSPNGNRCAIGALIPDHLYDPDMEDNSVDAVTRLYPAVARWLGVPEDEDSRERGKPIRFLSQLQSIHDKVEPPHLWPAHLRKLATEWNLDPQATYTFE